MPTTPHSIAVKTTRCTDPGVFKSHADWKLWRCTLPNSPMLPDMALQNIYAHWPHPWILIFNYLWKNAKLHSCVVLSPVGAKACISSFLTGWLIFLHWDWRISLTSQSFKDVLKVSVEGHLMFPHYVCILDLHLQLV